MIDRSLHHLLFHRFGYNSAIRESFVCWILMFMSDTLFHVYYILLEIFVLHMANDTVGIYVRCPPPLQVIVGSFIADGRNDTKSISQMEPLSAPPKLTPGGGVTGASSPQSHGTFSESSGGSPLNHSTGAFNNNNPQGISSMPWRWFLL